MEKLSLTFIVIGALLLAGLLINTLGRRTRLPRVTLLLVFGFAIGPAGFDILPDLTRNWFPFIANLALVMIGFLLGEKLGRHNLEQHGRYIIIISLAVVIVTTLVMFGGLWLIGVPAGMALLLAGIATATDPVATSDAVREQKAGGRFTSVLLGIVAVDDAWGLILFSVLLSIGHMLNGDGTGNGTILLNGLWELVGGIGLGVLLGLPMSYLTGRLRRGEFTLIEALGMVFLCTGLAMHLEVSYLLATVIMGATVANFARHSQRPFHAIADIEMPFLILFLVLAGASLQPAMFETAGWIGASYVVLRIAGRLAGGWFGGMAVGDPACGKWIGVALMPQAGVAMAMALVSMQHFPQWGQKILPIVIATTVLFEIVGPILTRYALRHSGEVEQGEQEPAGKDTTLRQE
ncbi:MAG: cation:proton antiporter [Granulosicoccaceae bacterium]|jgi:NhaP-type Na+/H+ or K+/H+ antiporter